MNLKNKRILITRPRAQTEEFANALIAEGAQPIFFPVIQIVPPESFSDLDHALQTLHQYDWLILTSVNAVDAFFKRLDFLGIKNIPSNLRLITIGSKTAESLSKYGISPDYIPYEYVSESILSGFHENISGKRFLLPQSSLARKALANEIRIAGGIADEVTAYQTIATQPTESELNELRIGVDIITFTSPSTVENFIDVVQKNGFNPLELIGPPLFACIGPVTKKAAENAGLMNLTVANKYTTDGLIDAISNLVQTY